ncbi:MAG TPA: hypothetical protein ENK57_09435, partial [Polyangiaceae bacterium]|nr:hypothetical protein [Polyangiaceae bacterium]
MCLLGLLLAGACGEEAAPPPIVPAPEASREQDSPPPPPREGSEHRAAPPAAPDGPVRVRYDLARHVARAELFHGEARVIDLGAPSGQQHTLGGWRTRTGESAEIEDTTVSLLTHVTGFYLLPIESTARCHLSMRARGFGDGRVTVYIDDETVGHVRLPSGGE